MSDDAGLLVVHFSNPEIGGAEQSLLAEMASLQKVSRAIRCILPADGSVSATCREQKMDLVLLPWPFWVFRFTQHQLWWKWLLFLLWPLGLPSLIRYLSGLKNVCQQADTLLSSGIKSHCFIILLAPMVKCRIIFNVRDFIEPLLFRKLVSIAAFRLGIDIIVNSKAVGKDYRRVKVRYPRVTLPKPAINRRAENPDLVISHVSFFAPYKGQDLFLNYARKILDAGVRAHFNLGGDVIYPAPRYRRYKKKVLSLMRELRLEEHVSLLGRVDDVQSLLESTHLLLHCTRDPEPFGRIVMEALLCGCEALCHRKSGVCEVTETKNVPSINTGIDFGGEYVFLQLPEKPTSAGRFLFS